MDADQLLENYLGGKVPTPKGTDTPMTGDDYLKSYLSGAPAAAIPADLKRVNIDTTPKPPISGATAEQSANINAQPSVQGGENPREGILQVPLKAGVAGYNAAKSGVLSAGKGIGDILTNKPASGFGKIGAGALDIATSPAAAVEQFAGDVTGSKDIAERAGFVAGALPVSKLGKYVPLRVPTPSNLNPLTYPNVVKNKALSELVDKITSQGREPEKLIETINAMKANPRLGPADLSPAVLNMGQKLFTTEGDVAKNYLHSTSTARIKSSADTVNSAYDIAAGIPVNAVNKLKELSEAAKAVGKKEIEPALASTPHAEVTPVISFIDNEIGKPAMKSIKAGRQPALPLTDYQRELLDVRNKLRGDWPDRDRMFSYSDQVHEVQAKLRQKADALLSSSTGSDRYLGGQLMDLRNKLVDSIDKASPKIKINVPNSNKPNTILEINGKKYSGDTPQEARANYNANKEHKETIEKEVGSYKAALSNYRDEKNISEAFHDAYNGVLTNSKKLENRPEFTKEWFNGLTEHEKKAAIEGIRTRIDTEIGVAKNPALAGTSLGKSGFNQKKMEAILGKEETTKLLNTLESERAISNTHNKIIEGSQTEMRRASDAAVALPEKSDKSPLNKYALPIAAGVAEAGSSYLGASGAGSLAVGALAGASKLGSMAKHKVATALAKERNFQLAKMALPVEGPSRDQLIRDLESFIPGPKKSLLTRGTNRMSKIIGP